MKRNKIVKKILKRTGALKILYGFIIMFLCIAFAIMLVEPKINNYADSIWYCFSVITTIGFGDVTAATLVGRILTILLSIYAILVIALIPGLLTSYYIESVKVRSNESMEKFMYDLERLPELSKDELTELSEKVKRFNKNKK